MVTRCISTPRHQCHDALCVHVQGAYFLGKAIWAKGYLELLSLLAQHKQHTEGEGGAKVHVDIVGSGEDLDEIKEVAARLAVDAAFHEATDHLEWGTRGHQVNDARCRSGAEGHQVCVANCCSGGPGASGV